MSVIVLSKNYATSESCLFEIQTILEHRKKKPDHIIFPVFYEVDPGEIEEQAKKLDFRGKNVTDEEVKGWSAALKEVASMGGFVYGNNRSEAKFIEEIIGALKSKQADNHLRDLNENMQTLKRKAAYLIGKENDINSEISIAERRPGKRPKKEVEVWLKDVQRFKNDVQRLEQEVVGATNVSSCMQLGKDIAKKILEVEELHKKGGDFSNSLMIDELRTGRMPLPLTKDFVDCTKARNTKNIWECVMNDDITKIGVYGMGGVGKTTIMKYIHNQLLKEKGKFDYVYWVTVSKEFDITKLQSDIAKALDLPPMKDEEVIKRAAKLLAALNQPKRYVLILDDVWEPFDLDSVGIPEPKRSNGCKLVLTMRKLEVCRRMECTPVRVDLFTEEEALTLFRTKAVGHDTVLTPEEEEIATKIAKECACLPLAIVTLASSLLGLKETHEWRNALNELISSTKDACDVLSKVFEQLKYSYSRLGNKVLQDCFLYCSLYPEHHDIPVNKLIEYWIAEELIADMDNVEAQFDEGRTVLGKLTSSCLLESVPDIYGRTGYVRVHDLIRDMAIKITRSSPRFMVKAGKRIKYVPSLEKLKALKMFVLTYSDIEELPEGIEELDNLRKLDLSRNYSIQRTFRTLKLHRLTKLQYLRIDGTGVEVSAEDLLSLSQLKVVGVHFHNVQELTRYAISQQFQGLQKYCLIVGNRHSVERAMGKEFSINFESAPFRSGIDQLVLPADIESFRLDGFHNPISLSAIPWFKDAKYLRKFEIKCCKGLESIFSSSTFSEDGQISLETIESFDLIELPRFRVLFDGIAPPHNIYFNLKELSFEKCDAVKNVFPVQLLQNFPNLESLSVESCENVEDIIVEMAEMSDRGYHQDYSNSISLPKLETLKLRDLPRLKSIYNGVMVCPSIKDVDVCNCPMVRRMPLSLHMDGEQATAPPARRYIYAEKEWWESLEWDDPLTKTILQPYVDYYSEDSKDSNDNYSEDFDDDYSDSDDDLIIDLNKLPEKFGDVL